MLCEPMIFRVFFEARKEALLGAIEEAMGKKIIRELDDLPDLFDIAALLKGSDTQN